MPFLKEPRLLALRVDSGVECVAGRHDAVAPERDRLSYRRFPPACRQYARGPSPPHLGISVGGRI